MLETRTRTPLFPETTRLDRGPRPRLELELRDVANEIVGRLDRDELSLAQEQLVIEAIDAAVVAALPEVVAVLDRELTRGLDALPPATRVTLARARRRRDRGLD
jgi:hypothetical protein